MKWNKLRWKRPCTQQDALLKSGLVAFYRAGKRDSLGDAAAGQWYVRIKGDTVARQAASLDDEWIYLKDVLTTLDKIS